MCKNLFKNGEYQLDHIKPVVDLKKPEYTIEEWLRALLCKAENFQLLCETCHKIKSGIEGQLRTRKKKPDHHKSIDLMMKKINTQRIK